MFRMFITWFLTLGVWCCSQFDIAGNRKAIVIHVPYRLRKAFRKIHVRLVRELEKKFSGKVINTIFILNPFGESKQFPTMETGWLD